MSYLMAILMGIIQGVAEFLPISSSGHLALFQQFFGMENMEEKYMMFTVMLHFGTLISVLVVYWKDVVEMIREFFLGIAALAGKDTGTPPPPARRMVMLIIIATLPLFVMVLLQDAVNAVPYDTPAEIVISEGIYKEKLFSDKRSLTMRGIGDVSIIWSDSALDILDGRKRGTFRSYTAFFSGHSLHLENLTIENGTGSGAVAGQGIALYLDTERAELDNVRIIGHQDTLFLSPLPDKEREPGGFYGPRFLSPRKRTASLFRHCTIEGGVDFIFGSGDALFQGFRKSLCISHAAMEGGREGCIHLMLIQQSYSSLSLHCMAWKGG